MNVLVATLLLCAALESDPQFKQAQKHMDAFELEKAAAVLDEISKRPELAAQDKALALVWLGIAYAELRDEARASIAFEDAVTADPLIVLPKDSSPKIKALLDDARARVRLRPRAAEPTPAPAPAPLAPAAPPPAAASEGGGLLFPAGLATAIAGGAVAIGGGVTWGVGLALRQQAVDAKFQDEAAALNEQSGTAQVVGQVALGVGAVVAIVGGVLIGLSFAE